MTSSLPIALGTASGVTVCIGGRNKAGKIRPGLETVAWADEIGVLDLESTACSASAARARVVSHGLIPIVELDERIAPRLPATLRGAAALKELGAVAGMAKILHRVRHRGSSGGDR